MNKLTSLILTLVLATGILFTIPACSSRETLLLSVRDDSTAFPLQEFYWRASKPVTWYSDTPEVASIDENGTVKTHKPGQTFITATAADGTSKTVSLTILPTEIVINGATSAHPGETIKWTITSKVWWVYWTSGNPSVATIDQEGNITAHRPGQTHITATSQDGTKKTVTFTVLPSDENSVAPPTPQDPQTTTSVPSSTPASLSSLQNLGKATLYNSTSSVLTDNFGNKYNSGIFFFQSEGFLEYNTNKQYTRFTATLYRPDGSTGDIRRLQIYGDGKLIYTSPDMHKDSAPVNIDINIAEYSHIKLESWSSDHSSDAVHLANAGFYK